MNEVLVVRPQFLFGVLPSKAHWGVLDQGVVIDCGPGSASRRLMLGRTPDAVGHPVIAQNGDLGPSQVTNRFLVVFDLFVSSW